MQNTNYYSGSQSPEFRQDHDKDASAFQELNKQPVSYYPNLFATEAAGSIGLGDLLRGIRNGQWRGPVQWIRNVLRVEGEEIYKEKKKQLPAVSVSGIISGQRKDAHLEGRHDHTGVMQVDIDGKDHPDLAVNEIKSLVIASGLCVTVFDSPSGLGVKALVFIEPDVSKHEGSFWAVEKKFLELGLKIDPATKDPGRLMLVSSDSNFWMNPNKPPVIPALPPKEVPDPQPAAKSKESYAVSVEEIRTILSYIPKRPDYDTWIRVAWAVFFAVGLEIGLELLKEWSPEEKPGEYAKLYRPDKNGAKVGIGTLIKFAKEGGYTPPVRIPENVIPVPCGSVGHHQSSMIIFATMAAKGDFYFWGNKVVEVIEDSDGGAKIVEVTPERLVEHVERLGKRVARRESVSDNTDSTGPDTVRMVWRTTTMPVCAAKIALQSEAAKNLLPPLRQVVNAPIIIERGNGQSEILGHGYHRDCGGTFVAAEIELEEVPGGIQTAVALLNTVLSDFCFATESDRSRALASLISPALKAGGLINGDFPLDFAEADESQSGKTYRQKAVARLYNEIPSVITARKGGVGGLDESVANALLSGGTFIAMDNMRGTIDSALLETALRGQGYAECRGFRANGRVDLTPFLWQLSTNGAEPTRDLVNRSIIVRIKKQPADYKFEAFPEGDLLANISARRGLYLAAVFEIVREWIRLGKPRTDDVRHDFREWAQSLDWIIQHLCGMPPLLDGHREEQLRNADPGRQWLRSVLLAVGPLDRELVFTASRLADIATEAGIDLPGTATREDASMRVGKILGGIFRRADSEKVVVDGFSIVRDRISINTAHGPKSQPQYRVRRIQC